MKSHVKMWRSNAIQSSSWIGHEVQKVKVWMWIWYCSNQKVGWVTISNFLGWSLNPRSIGSISSIIGQAQVIKICKWKMSYIDNATHINTKDVKYTHKKERKYTHNKKIISMNKLMSTSCVWPKGLRTTRLSAWTNIETLKQN